jgi:hypothetical protein
MPKATVKQEKVPLYPKDVGACIDKLYKDREKRIVHERSIALLKQDESGLKQHIIGLLNAAKLEGGKGKVAIATRQIKRTWVLDKERWNDYWEFARKDKTGSFVEHRISVEAINEAFAAGKKVPAVTPVDIVTLSINKVGKPAAKRSA